MAVLVPKVELDDFEHLLAELVAKPSVSSPDPSWDQSNESVIGVLESWFTKLGFTTEVVTVDPVLGKYNLVARMGEGEKGLVLAGHTDTVPYDQTRWASDPFTLKYEAGKYWGLGTCDMKGFFPIIIQALRSLEGMVLGQPLIILATADEESSMAGARLLSNSGGIQARAAIIGEPTEINPVRAHKGILMESISISGKAGHSSNPALGNNALEALHDFMGLLMQYREKIQTKYRSPLFEVDVPTLNLGSVCGGDSPNRICGHCSLSFDLRPLPGMDIDTLQRDISALARKTGHAHKVDIQHKGLIEPVLPFETAADAELVKICEQVSGHTSKAVAFATEAPFLKAMGMETVVMGAGSIDQAHQPNEFLELAQVEKMSAVLSKLIQHYCADQIVGTNHG